jgi:hypothetical protein
MEQLLNWVLKLRNIPFPNDIHFVDFTKYKKFAFWGTLRNRMIYDIQQAINTKRRLYAPYSSQRFIGRFSYLLIAYFFVVALVSKILCFIIRPKAKESKYTLFATTDFSSMRVVKNPVSKQFEFGHSIFHPVFQKIFKNFPHIRVVSGYPFGFTLYRNIRLALNMRRSEVVGHFNPLESYTSVGSFLEIIRAKCHFSRVLRQLKSEASKNNLLSFNNVNLLTALPNYFEYYFHTFLPLAALYLDLSQRALKEESPNTLLLVDEYLLYGRSLLFAAAEEKVPSLAIQHGVIFKFHPGYIYDQDEISQDGNPFFPYSPLPTKTALYGQFYERILIEHSAYPKSRLVVTGQPRYDVLRHANEIYDKREFCQRYNLDSKTRIVLIVTQPFPVKKARTEFVIPTSQALDQIPNLQIVVKPHPSESSDFYKELLTKQGIAATVLSPKSDTVEAIFACDLFIAVNSTTIIEALILNKPVVVINLSNFPEVLPWVSDGAVVEVTNPNDLRAIFRRVLDDEKFLQAHSDGRKRFLEGQIYKDDGRATERVIAVLEYLISPNHSYEKKLRKSS